MSGPGDYGDMRAREARHLFASRFARGERGANLVEFAIVMPLLLLLLLGVIEFGYLLGEYNDVRHGAREGARLAAVSGTGDDEAALISRVCQAMDLTVGSMNVDFDSSSADVGSTASVTVTATVSSLSNLGLIEIFLPNTLATSVEFRLEQPRLWNPADAVGSC